jgi:hypothetical protein
MGISPDAAEPPVAPAPLLLAALPELPPELQAATSRPAAASAAVPARRLVSLMFLLGE